MRRKVDIHEFLYVGKVVRIITGRGKHSVNGVGVLGPAVRNALTSDGWIVDTVDGGLIVRGLAGSSH